MRYHLFLSCCLLLFLSPADYAQRTGDPAAAKALLNKVNLLNEQGDYAQALEISKQLLSIYTGQRDSAGIGAAYQSIGNDQQFLGNTREAIQDYLLACSIFQAIADNRDYLKTLNNISSVFIDLNEFNKAYGYALQSVALGRSLHDTSHIATGLINQGI